MRVCLAGAPTLGDRAHPDPIAEELGQRVPLGVLALASVLERCGLRPVVVDLDALHAVWREGRRAPGDFVRRAAGHLAGLAADLYGLGTICSSYPLTLRIATALREARPGCWIVLGGPQATAAAEETLVAFPAVDLVVRGEGETVLPLLLDALASSGDPSSVPGITFRSGSSVARSPDAPLLGDLDALPLAAYHLHHGLRRGGCLPLEVGRGCPFSCSFCSTSRFFGHRFRMKSPQRIVQDMLALRRRWGTRRFDLVHDNFTVDRARVVAFCESLAAAGGGFLWSCSSRTDSLDDDLLGLMWKAGCSGLFLGIESGSAAMQGRMGKRLDLAGARALLRLVDRRRIPSTVSFIAGFPDESREDLADTVSFFVDTLRHDFLQPQISLLSPLTGTPLHRRHRGELVLDGIVSDMAFQGEALDRPDADLIARHPGIFSCFYAVPTPGLDRGELEELRLFLAEASQDLRWLLVAAARAAGGGVAAFRAFRSWRSGRAPRGARLPAARYYAAPAFRRDFARFVREALAPRLPAFATALRSLATFCAGLQGAERPLPRDRRRCSGPVRAPGVRAARLDCDGLALIRCLRSGGDLAGVPRRSSTLVARPTPGRREILQLGPEAADLLRLCDGTRDAAGVASAFERLHPEVGGVPGKAAALFGLERLRRRGLLAASRGLTSPPAPPGGPSSRRGAAGPGRRRSSARAGARGP